MVVMKVIKIEIAYALPDKQCILPVEVESGCTVAAAIEQSGILNLFPEIDLNKQSVGIFSKSCHLSDNVQEGDRVEIYRPLIIDPKEARRTKAKRTDKPKKQPMRGV